MVFAKMQMLSSPRIFGDNVTELPEHKCKGCQKDCWGKEWDEEKEQYFCKADGFYIQQKEKVKFS
jgi:hypothetical protein